MRKHANPINTVKCWNNLRLKETGGRATVAADDEGPHSKLTCFANGLKLINLQGLSVLTFDIHK